MEADSAVLWRPAITGVEVLHAHFRRHAYTRHAHEALTIALVDAGTVTFGNQGSRSFAPAGSVFMINPETVHDGRSATPAGYRYRVLYVDPGLLDQLTPRHGGRAGTITFRRTVVQDVDLTAALRGAHDSLAGATSLLEQEGRLLHMGTLLLNRYGERSRSTLDEPRGGRRAVQLAREYLNAHLAENVSLRSLAAIASLSPYSLVRGFTAELGMPPHAYQTDLRVRRARRLLGQALPPALVASETGFYDQSHLTNVFKRHVGVTPARYAAGTAG